MAQVEAKADRQVRGRPAKYPFATMQVGDSFTVPATGITSSVYPTLDRAHTNIHSAAAQHCRRHQVGFRLSVIQVDPQTIKATRVA